MSRPNWGSVVEVETPLNHSHVVSHWAEAAKPAKKPKKIGMPPHRQATERLDDLLVAVELRAQTRVHRPQP